MRLIVTSKNVNWPRLIWPKHVDHKSYYHDIITTCEKTDIEMNDE